MTTAPYFAILGLLTIAHAANVIRLRRAHKIGIGDGGNRDLARMMRVFGNFIEYVPLGLVLLIGLEITQAPTWYLHLAGSTLLLGRVLHAAALGRSTGASSGRVYGMMLTLGSIAISSIGIAAFTYLSP